MKIPLADLLSITTGVLLSHDHMGGVYRTLNFLTGDSLMTHQLPAACDVMRPVLLAQMPWLATVAPPHEAATDELMAWRDWAELEYGTEFEVTAPPSSLWGEHDAIQELIDMVGADRVIPVVLSDETSGAS